MDHGSDGDFSSGRGYSSSTRSTSSEISCGDVAVEEITISSLELEEEDEEEELDEDEDEEDNDAGDGATEKSARSLSVDLPVCLK